MSDSPKKNVITLNTKFARLMSSGYGNDTHETGTTDFSTLINAERPTHTNEWGEELDVTSEKNNQSHATLLVNPDLKFRATRVEQHKNEVKKVDRRAKDESTEVYGNTGLKGTKSVNKTTHTNTTTLKIKEEIKIHIEQENTDNRRRHKKNKCFPF